MNENLLLFIPRCRPKKKNRLCVNLKPLGRNWIMPSNGKVNLNQHRPRKMKQKNKPRMKRKNCKRFGHLIFSILVTGNLEFLSMSVLRIYWFIKAFFNLIIFVILITYLLDILILYGEIRCWSLV